MSKAARFAALAALLLALCLTRLGARSLVPELMDRYDLATLERMARSHGLDPSGGEAALRSRLKAFWEAVWQEEGAGGEAPAEASAPQQEAAPQQDGAPKPEASFQQEAAGPAPGPEAPEGAGPLQEAAPVSGAAPQPEAVPQQEAGPKPEAASQPDGAPKPEAAPAPGEGYRLVIESCDSVVLDKSTARMEGDVRLSFTSGGEGRKTLSADEVLMEADNKTLTAMGGAVFKDEGRGSAQILRGDMVSYNWESADANLTGGLISSVRTNNEGKKIEFYASGTTISYLGKEDVVILDDGRIATRAQDPYWGIKSRKTALLDNGDLFIFDATLNLGRIPVLWMPAFFYSGSRLVFNPAIGLASDRGMFLNTTTEIYGAYKVKEATDRESSSFAALLRTSEEGEMERRGIIYQKPDPGRSPGAVERWAKETGSHMAFIADVYEKGGLFLGLDTKNSFLKKKIRLDFFGGLAKDFAYKKRGIRFFGYLSGKIDLDRIKLDFSLPCFSDGEAPGFYGNRLSAFTFDALLGNPARFPSDRKAAGSFEWKLDGSFSAPVSRAGKLVDRAEVSSLDVKLRFAPKRAGRAADPGPSDFQLESARVPGFATYVGGTLLDLSASRSKETKKRPGGGQGSALKAEFDAALEAEDSPRADGGGAQGRDNTHKPNAAQTGDAPQKASGAQGGADARQAGDGGTGPALLKPYMPEGSAAGPALASDSLSLSYNWKQKFSNDLENLDRGPAGTLRKIYWRTDGALALKTRLGGGIFSLEDTVLPSYEYSGRDGEAAGSAKVLNKLAASIPAAGVAYRLDWKVLDYKKGAPAESFLWDRGAVSAHSLAFSLPLGPFRLSLSQTLPPTRKTLTASASLRIDGLAASLSQKFKEKGKALRPAALALDLSFSGGTVDVRLGAGCDFSREGGVWNSFHLSQSLLWRLWDNGPALSGKLRMRERFRLKSLDLSLSHKGCFAALGFGPKAGGGGIRPENLEARIDIAKRRLSFWKGRVAAEVTLKVAYSHNFLNKFASDLRTSADLRFSIAEFLDFRLSASSENNGFYKYYDGSRFVFARFVEDLARSFDFAGGGRRRTSFNLSAIEAELTHYMRDWDFHCKYKGGVVLSKGTWNWRESVSFYVQWGAIPDIKTEKTEEW